MVPFSSVSAVDFEQVNICWALSYQFVNDEITYCCNYWQMHQNPSETQADNKRLLSKVVVPKKTNFPVGFCVWSQGTGFFSEYSVSLFRESSCSHPFLNRYGTFRRAHAAMNCVYTMYLTDIWVNSQFQLQLPIRWMTLFIL